MAGGRATDMADTWWLSVVITGVSSQRDAGDTGYGRGQGRKYC